MGYLITLFLLLAAVFSFTSGGLPGHNIIGKAKSSIVDFIAPKNEHEITVDNLQRQYRTLDEFFAATAPAVLKSSAVSAKDKTALQSAIKAFQESKPLVTKLEQATPQDAGLIRSALIKALGLGTTPAPDPTSIPPQCHLTCSQ